MTPPRDEDDEPASLRPVAPDPLVGMTVADRYRILGPLGAGGMGVVYKVEHVRIGKLMAMKLLSGELSRDPQIVKRFKREAQLASKLSHANTVQVFDFGQADGLTYLVMELVPGEDLARLTRSEGTLGYLRVARLVVQVCGSLAEAHRAGIVHRDLKPENVMVVRTEGGRTEIAKVCDFGLAKLRESTEASNDVTSHGAVVGTPYYMSPEQIRGEDVDLRTDVYALGGVMYKLLTGSPPFTGGNPMAVFARHLTEPATAPSVRAPELGIPARIDAIVLRALAKRRDDRYASVEELQEELLDVLRAGNVSSAEMLVDSGQMRDLAHRAVAGTEALEHTQLAGVMPKAATRDEVEAFERKLVRQRRLGQLGLVLGIAGLGFLGARAYALATAPVPFDGQEREPNDDASRAQAIPWGSSVRGYVGKRISPQMSDRDFFAFEVPGASATGATGATGATSFVHLRTTALSNFATCTLLYRAGTADALARFCTGAAAKELDLPVLRVDPGRYLVAVMQDMDAYGADAPPPVLENVSDAYTLELTAATPDPARETEPNDAPAAANRVPVGGELRGQLQFVRDVDVLCPDERAAGTVRWVVRDAVERARDAGALLEATVERGDMKEATRVFVHRQGVVGTASATHVVGAWTTPSIKLDGSPPSGCLRLRLALDPWATGGPKVPPTGSEQYVVRLEPAP